MGCPAIIAGRLADLFGRKTVLVSAAGLFSVATTLEAASPDFLRHHVAAPSLSEGRRGDANRYRPLADLIPARRRGAMVAAAYAGVGLGKTVVSQWLPCSYRWRLAFTSCYRPPDPYRHHHSARLRRPRTRRPSSARGVRGRRNEDWRTSHGLARCLCISTFHGLNPRHTEPLSLASP